jgi:hypothetical protein
VISDPSKHYAASEKKSASGSANGNTRHGASLRLATALNWR